MQSLFEHNFAATLWGAIHDNAYEAGVVVVVCRRRFLIFRFARRARCVEQGVRMSAMDSASTNASDLRKKFTLQYNKTRQSVITTELSGALRLLFGLSVVSLVVR